MLADLVWIFWMLVDLLVFFKPCVRSAEDQFDEVVEVPVLCSILDDGGFYNFVANYEIEYLSAVVRSLVGRPEKLVRQVCTIEEIYWIVGFLPAAKKKINQYDK